MTKETVEEMLAKEEKSLCESYPKKIKFIKSQIETLTATNFDTIKIQKKLLELTQALDAMSAPTALAKKGLESNIKAANDHILKLKDLFLDAIIETNTKRPLSKKKNTFADLGETFNAKGARTKPNKNAPKGNKYTDTTIIRFAENLSKLMWENDATSLKQHMIRHNFDPPKNVLY